MSGKSRKRKRKTPVIDPPSLEEISLPMAQLPRLESDASGIRDVKSSPDGPVREWSTVDVVDALQKKRIEDHILQLFKKHRIEGKHLAGLSRPDLKDMGIEAVGVQKNVLDAVRALTSSNKMEKVFNDPVHGHIELHPLMVMFIDTPQFQRLRYIKQLGGGYYVFPGASHNRFEHSIGVGYLAGELAETLQRKQGELDITDVDVLCVKLAGLCHDLGHGPLSHLFDGKFIPKVLPGSEWKHEEASVMMLDHLIQENGLKVEMEKYGLDDNDILFIKELIVGPIQDNFTTPDKNKKYKGRPESKRFLYEIVANKETGVDVDKWDYFARDCHHLGIPNGFDLRRYMTFVRVIEVDGRQQMCIRDKEAANLYEMFHTRTTLHRKAYQHKTSNIIEQMITEALVAADEHLKIPGKNGKMVKMSEAIKDPVAFTRLTDQVLQQIQLSTDPNLKAAKEILAKVEKRKLYKHVGQTQAQTSSTEGQTRYLSKEDESRICKEMIQSLSPEELDGLPHLSEDDIIVLIATFDYGKKEKNPIDLVRFYAKESPHVASSVRKYQVSQMLPPTFLEQQIRVFCKKDDKPSLEAARKYFTTWCRSSKDVTSSGHEGEDESAVGDTTLTNSPYIPPPSGEPPSHTTVRSSAVKNLFS